MTGSADRDLETIAGLLAKPDVRAILAAVARQPRSTAELTDVADVSRQTVYRRLERLEAAGLVAERTNPRPDGHHESVYTATLRELRVALSAEGFTVEVETEPPARDPADELTDLWRSFGR